MQLAQCRQSGLRFASAWAHLRALSSEVGSASIRLLVLYRKSGTACRFPRQVAEP